MFRLPVTLVAALLLLSSTLSAQSPQPRTPHVAAPRLTPQQKIGLEILDQQAGVARNLTPATRAFALLEVARGYEQVARPKALAALRHALQATQSMQEEQATDGPPQSTKDWLQGQIISRLVELDPAFCEQLIPQLSGSAKTAAIADMVRYYTGKKQFSPAVSLLTQLGDQEFPYMDARNLLQALPPEMAADKQNLFAQALASFTQHQHKGDPMMNGFGEFIAGAWRGLPPDLVLQAVDEVLKQARQFDVQMQITVGAQKGAASFRSIYEYQLFELLPIVRALDPERAQRLLQDNRDLQAALKQYPDGLQSLDPKRGMPQSMMMRVADSGGSAANDRYAAELQRRTEQILAQADKDPKQALAATMSLPDFHNTRAMALLRLAGTLRKGHPSYARDTLEELLKIVPSIPEQAMRAPILAEAGNDYFQMGDIASTGKVVDQGFKLAETLYAADTDADDPNQAAKAEWPSTSVWRQFVALATRISPQTALQAINSIPDPEIQCLETIALADSLLGAPPGLNMTAVKSKNKNMYMMGVPGPN